MFKIQLVAGTDLKEVQSRVDLRTYTGKVFYDSEIIIFHGTKEEAEKLYERARKAELAVAITQMNFFD